MTTNPVTTAGSNKPDVIIARLINENRELAAKLERAHWKNRNQKQEIRKLNRANIDKIHLLNARDMRVLQLMCTLETNGTIMDVGSNTASTVASRGCGINCSCEDATSCVGAVVAS